MKGKLLKTFAVLTCFAMSTVMVACGGGLDNQQQGATENSSFEIVGGAESSSETDDSSEEISSDESVSEEISSEESASEEISSEESVSEEISSEESVSEEVSSEESASEEQSSETIENSEEGGEVQSFELVYALNQTGDGYNVRGYRGEPTALEIPSMYENLPVTGIFMNAFQDCDTLTSVVIPDSVATILENAFRKCDALTYIEIGAGVNLIERYAIYECPVLANIVVSENNETYQSIDGNLYSKDGKSFLLYATGKTETSFVIPDGVTAIGDDAFAYCETLTQVVLHNRIQSVGYWAFCFCTGLTEIVIPASVIIMRDYVFYGCSNLHIYCEVEIKPITWGRWNYTQCPVDWGYIAE